MELGNQLSWIFSTISNLLFLFIFIPQLITNYKLKNGEALSLNLIILWIFADIFSIIGAYIKNLSQIIIYVGFYQIIFDVIILSQILYYRHINTYNEISQIINTLNDNSYNEDNESNNLLNSENEIEHYFDAVEYIDKNHSYKYCLKFKKNELILFFILLFFTSIFFISYFLFNKSILGEIISWTCVLLEIFSRIPQIYLNFKRKSVKGLSILSFVIINLSNIIFVLSILILLIDIPNKNLQLEYLINNIQWIIGNLSTFFLDIIIFIQYHNYSN